MLGADRFPVARRDWQVLQNCHGRPEEDEGLQENISQGSMRLVLLGLREIS